MRKKIYLIDVSSMFFRAFYAVRPLTSSQGVPVNAVYGFISMIVKLIKEKNPEHIVFCYDRKEPSFRKEIYAEYKAHRTTMPDDLQVQMPYLKKVATLFGITDLEVPSFEADDLIGTIAKMAEKENYEVYIVSGDKDFCQLISPTVFLYDTMKEVTYDAILVKEKHGVAPEHFIDFLALTGDASDNIPGVSGIGPKGAIKLIEQFGTIEGIYDRIEDVDSATIKAKLLASKADAFLSKKLVTIVCNVKLGLTLDDFKRKELKTTELREFLRDLNFKSFEKSLLDQPADTDETAEKSKSVQNQALQTVEEVQSKALPMQQIQKLNWDPAEIQSRIDKKEKFFIFDQDEKIAIGFGNQIYATEKAHCRLKFEDVNWSGFNLKKVWHEIGFKLDQKQQGLLQSHIDWDLMLAAYVIRAADSSNIQKLAQFFLKTEMVDDLTVERFYEICLQLNQEVLRQLEEKNLLVIYKKMEKPLIPILFAMEQKGISLDIDKLSQYSKQLAQELAVQEETIYKVAGEKFNIASPKQLGVVLFEKLGLEVVKKNKDRLLDR